MRPPIANGAFVLASLAGCVFGNKYSLKDSIVAEQFYSAFTFETIPDPTHGRVNYVNQTTAQELYLAYTVDNAFLIRADDTNVLPPNGPGRDSVRLRSNKKYKTHVALFYMDHMPQGCGTWPAIWEANESHFPSGGEVAIVEGVNGVTPNLSALRTKPGCSIPASGVSQQGTTVSTNCDASADNNLGCGVKFTQDIDSFGYGFNSIGGGWYVIERTNRHISIWFWGYADPSAPPEVTNAADHIDTSTWGTPAAYFPNTHCNLASHLDAHNIFISLTFCGDWAGNSTVYAASGCPSTCVDYVNNNPLGFVYSYFSFYGLFIYE